jgi:acetyl-CoA synthase
MMPDTKIGFPNTAYYLPVIYSLTGLKCETLEDLKKPMAFARNLLPPHIKLKHWLPVSGTPSGCRHGRHHLL